MCSESIRDWTGIGEHGLIRSNVIDPNPQARRALRAQLEDPWRTMAIESQFCALVEPPHGLEPATLTYLDNARHKIWGQHGQALDNAVEALLLALQNGPYAKLLAIMIWGGGIAIRGDN